MPRQTSEGDKKHGDKLESFIDRTADEAEPREREPSADEDDPELLQDDDDEDVQSDRGTDRRDID